jgi:hypothetical protein
MASSDFRLIVVNLNRSGWGGFFETAVLIGAHCLLPVAHQYSPPSGLLETGPA